MNISYICLFVIINQHVCTTEEVPGNIEAKNRRGKRSFDNAKNSDMRVPYV